MYITVKQAAEKWGLSDRRVRILCAEGKIPGAFQEGRGWKIPADAVKPADGRFRSTESLLDMIDRKKAELDTRRPLTEGEVARLTEEFIVEYTYNSNAHRGQHPDPPGNRYGVAWSDHRSETAEGSHGGCRS